MTAWSQEKRREYHINGLVEEKKFRKNLKRHWSFECPACGKEVKSDTHERYFILEYGYDVNPIFLKGLDGGERLCSKECVAKLVDKEVKYFPETDVEAFEEIDEMLKERGR
ncbi:hypothetical protein [Priestia aryabhattai]|uniref:hypothetical protein n=1 Tax=Priestia aryabhattai TaxID=412384 RepID=UPI001C8D4C73|nr:hypothetical protein [Priestia aryabhattai]MBX9998159.1 hypothetical protein [Priestia aryabhattai]